MICDQCGEKYEEEEMQLTRCGLNLCGLCYEDHRREGCTACAEDEAFEAGDYLCDIGRGT